MASTFYSLVLRSDSNLSPFTCNNFQIENSKQQVLINIFDRYFLEKKIDRNREKKLQKKGKVCTWLFCFS